ncbi:MAG: hypothetical protein JWN86_3864 [Planctomycetota bacterium]|nr:hypothetical protein [Planctomycetota bacterium]
MRQRLLLVLAVTALHGAIAVVATSSVFFRINVATAQRVFGGSNGEKNLYEDVHAYHDYASGLMRGSVPYRDYPVEYPIAAFPLFLVPRLFAAGLDAFRWAFALEMLAFDALLVWLVANRAERTVGVARGLTWYSLGLAALGGLPIARFDVAPTALAFASALAWEAGRSGVGGVLAGVGGLMKLFPAVVAGPGFLSGRGSLRGMIAFGLTCLFGAIGWWALGGAGVAASMRYHAGRGLEIESLYAGLLIVFAKFAGMPISHDFNHSSVELITPGAAPIATVALAIQLGAIGLVLWRFRRCGRHDLPRFAGACILAFAVFGKVLSPQYVLWVLPFVATLGGRSGRWARPIVLAACVATSLVYFWAGVGVLMFHPLAVGLLNVRNALLVGLLGLMIWERSS